MKTKVLTASFIGSFLSVIVAIVVLLTGPLSARQISDTTEREHLAEITLRHKAGAGVSLCTSEISSGALTMMFSTFYQYRLTEVFALEASGNVLHRARADESFSYRTEILPSGQILVIPQYNAVNSVAHSMSGNLTFVFSPFDDRRFAIGVGPSFRWAGLLRSSIITRLDSLSQDFSLVDTQQYAIGANAHIEYAFALGHNVDLGLRLHSQLFFPPFTFIRGREPIGFIRAIVTSTGAVDGFPAAYYGLTIGIGAFLRVNF